MSFSIRSSFHRRRVYLAKYPIAIIKPNGAIVHDPYDQGPQTNHACVSVYTVWTHGAFANAIVPTLSYKTIEERVLDFVKRCIKSYSLKCAIHLSLSSHRGSNKTGLHVYFPYFI